MATVATSNLLDPGALIPPAGQILLITGPSGAGKSSLLRRIVAQRPRGTRCIDLTRLRLPDRPLVDCFGEAPLEALLPLLGRVGLAEAWSYLRTPGQLSDGQRWRLRLALALHRATKTRITSQDQARAGAPIVIVADEFAALLDRVTAAIVARALRRAVDESSRHLAAIVATSHDDLVAALAPQRLAVCDFTSTRIEPPVL